MANSIRDVFRRVLSKVERATPKGLSRSNLDKVAKETAESVRVRTRLGRGVDKHEGASFRLPGIKESTKKSRRRKKARGQLSKFTTPNRSNLTETGQLLDAIKGKAAGRNTIEIELKEGRNDGAQNSDINKGQEAMGRSFMNLSKAQVKEIRSKARRLIKKELSKLT